MHEADKCFFGWLAIWCCLEHESKSDSRFLEKIMILVHLTMGCRLLINVRIPKTTGELCLNARNLPHALADSNS